MFYRTIHFKFVQNNFSMSQKILVMEAFISVQNKAVFWSKPLLWKEEQQQQQKMLRRSELQENKCHVAEIWQDRLLDPSLLQVTAYCILIPFVNICYHVRWQSWVDWVLSVLTTDGWAPCNLKYVFPLQCFLPDKQRFDPVYRGILKVIKICPDIRSLWTPVFFWDVC